MTAVDTPNAPDPSEQLELKLPGESRDWREVGLWAGVLVLLVLVTYWPAVGGKFLWRDDAPVARDGLLAAPGGLAEVWAGRWTHPQTYRPFTVYQPVAFTAYWLTYFFGGRGANGLPTPTAYHVVGLALHAAAAVLAWLTLRELRVPGAWLAAAVFALHPANAEAVAWVRDQHVVLGGALFWAAAYTYMRFVAGRERDWSPPPGVVADPGQTWGLYAGAAGLYLLACLAWQATFVLPVLIFLALRWRRMPRYATPVLLGPWLVVGGLLFLTNHELQANNPLWHGGVRPPIGLVGSVMGFALLDVVAPFHLSIVYPFRSLSPVPVGLSVMVVGAIAAAAVARRRVGAGPLVAVASFAVCAVAGANYFEPARLTKLADPAVYLAIVPLAAGVVAAVTTAIGDRVQVAVVASAVVVAGLGVGGAVRGRVFADDLSLWRDTAGKYPASPMVQSAYAEQLRLAAVDAFANGATKDVYDPLLDAAIDHAGTALAVRPVDVAGRHYAAQAEQTLANVALARAHRAEARQHFKAAIADDYTYAAVRVEYAAFLNDQKEYDEAREQLNEALADYGSSPESAAAAATAHRLMGQTFEGLGTPEDLKRAVNECEQAVQMSGGDPADREAYAVALSKAGRLEDAVGEYIQIIGPDKAYNSRPDVWVTLADLKFRMSEKPGATAADRYQAVAVAVDCQQAALKLDPNLAGGADTLKRYTAALAGLAAATRPSTTGPTTAAAATRPSAGGP